VIHVITWMQVKVRERGLLQYSACSAICVIHSFFIYLLRTRQHAKQRQRHYEIQNTRYGDAGFNNISPSLGRPQRCEFWALFFCAVLATFRQRYPATMATAAAVVSSGMQTPVSDIEAPQSTQLTTTDRIPTVHHVGRLPLHFRSSRDRK